MSDNVLKDAEFEVSDGFKLVVRDDRCFFQITHKAENYMFCTVIEAEDNETIKEALRELSIPESARIAKGIRKAVDKLFNKPTAHH